MTHDRQVVCFSATNFERASLRPLSVIFGVAPSRTAVVRYPDHLHTQVLAYLRKFPRICKSMPIFGEREFSAVSKPRKNSKDNLEKIENRLPSPRTSNQEENPKKNLYRNTLDVNKSTISRYDSRLTWCKRNLIRMLKHPEMSTIVSKN